MPEIKICNRSIGPNHPPLVIAEIGINHGGCLEAAFEMVDAAKSAGVEVLKHQTHVVDDEMSGAAKKVIPGNTDESIYEVMARCALSEAEEIRLKEYVELRHFFCGRRNFLTASFLRGYISDQEVDVIFRPSDFWAPQDPLKPSETQ